MGLIKLIRAIRCRLLSRRFKSCGTHFVCCSGTTVRGAGNISVGNNVRFGEKSFINGLGGIEIGNNVLIGPQVFIWSANHNYDSGRALPYDNTQEFRKVTICDNVWIAARVCIIPGVTIGEGAVIGMGAVVTKDVPPCAVVGGNPAKVLKYRNMEHYNKLKAKQINSF